MRGYSPQNQLISVYGNHECDYINEFTLELREIDDKIVENVENHSIFNCRRTQQIAILNCEMPIATYETSHETQFTAVNQSVN